KVDASRPDVAVGDGVRCDVGVTDAALQRETISNEIDAVLEEQAGGAVMGTVGIESAGGVTVAADGIHEEAGGVDTFRVEFAAEDDVLAVSPVCGCLAGIAKDTHFRVVFRDGVRATERLRAGAILLPV